MTDADFVLSVLEDGEPHSQAELLRRSFQERGFGLTVHSRVASLRERGHVIVCERVKGKTRGEGWRYQLLGSLPEGEPLAADSYGGNSPSESEPEPLFDLPQKPAWA